MTIKETRDLAVQQSEEESGHFEDNMKSIFHVALHLRSPTRRKL